MGTKDGFPRRRAIWLGTTALLGSLAATARAAAAGPVAQAPSAAAAKPKPRAKPRVVVIDPGHGGGDPGTIGVSGTYEKTVVMQVAVELARQYQATGRYRPVLTRSRDSYLPLRDRVAHARAAKADLFLSLHADWHPDSGTQGATVYTLSEDASDREAAALAAKENKADVVAGVDFRGKPPEVASILIDLSQRETINQSRVFAGQLVDALARGGVALLPRSHRYAGFAVLTAPDTPAVLLEIGYMSNPREERLMRQPAHQRRIAQSVLDATDRYFASRPRPPEPSPSPPAVSKPGTGGTPPRTAAPPAPKKA
ncbi:MAG: N-acetylmuramoyl-L-alanine amidase [Rhodospirillales bacterium]|nr:N-acetylmuramoyl-L-alanine amidase [Rhodospirillales bacterium]